uniref:Uncharacterized protein n=1 Tax=Ascaris lumbricoides TaxID=6252 RepID=A0A0M3HV66_ASCLU
MTHESYRIGHHSKIPGERVCRNLVPRPRYACVLGIAAGATRGGAVNVATRRRFYLFMYTFITLKRKLHWCSASHPKHET